MAEDLGERTEKPTERRLEDARERGQVARSADLSSAIILGVGLALLLMLAHWMFRTGAFMMRSSLGIDALAADTGPGALIPELLRAAASAASLSVPMMLVIMGVALVGGLSQVGWGLSTAPLEPKWGRLNVLTNAKNLLGRKALVKGGLDLLKFVIVSMVAFFVISGRWREVLALGNLPTPAAMAVAGGIVRELAIWIIAVLVLLGIADFLFQRWEHRHELRMTKQEIKDERKSNEGDAEIKGRRLRIARQIAMQRVGAAIPKADVVVTNPTHYAVALKYDMDAGMRAPRVIAKGADYLALKMRYLAASSGVPIVERPPLARALYQSVPVGREIFPEHYEAVAEVLAYVYRLNQSTRAAG